MQLSLGRCCACCPPGPYWLCSVTTVCQRPLLPRQKHSILLAQRVCQALSEAALDLGSRLAVG